MTADGRYLITSTQVTGDLSIGDVSDGQMVNRAWSFAVNQDPEFQSFLDNETQDPSNALMYYDVGLYADGTLLLNVNDPKLIWHPETVEFRGAMSPLKRTRYAGHSWTLEFSEMVVRDAQLLGRVLAQAKAAAGARRAPAIVFLLVQKATSLAEA